MRAGIVPSGPSCPTPAARPRLGKPGHPGPVDLKTIARFSPEVLRRPRWLLSYAKTGKVPDLTVPQWP